MFKEGLIQAIVSRTGRQRRDVEAVFGALWDVIVDELRLGNDVTITGVCNFRIRRLQERVIKHPRNGKLVHVHGNARVVFRPGSRFRNLKLR